MTEIIVNCNALPEAAIPHRMLSLQFAWETHSHIELNRIYLTMYTDASYWQIDGIINFHHHNRIETGSKFEGKIYTGHGWTPSVEYVIQGPKQFHLTRNIWQFDQFSYEIHKNQKRTLDSPISNDESQSLFDQHFIRSFDSVRIPFT